MDKEALEILMYFRENVFELKKLGKEWGLSDSEIAQCIDQAIIIKPQDLPQASTEIGAKLSARKTWVKVRNLLYFCIAALLVIVGIAATGLGNETIKKYYSDLIEPFRYPVTRVVRTMAVAFQDTVDVYDLLEEPCVVANPWFNPEQFLENHICENCAGITSATQFTSSSLEQGGLLDSAFIDPVLFKGKGPNVSLETLQVRIRSHPPTWEPFLGVKSNLAWATQLKDLLDQDAAQKLDAQPDFHFEWVSRLVGGSRILKDTFQTPAKEQALASKRQKSVVKHLILLGPKAAAVQLSKAHEGFFSVYDQAHGSAEVELTPVTMCIKECSPVRTLLHAGDFMVFNHAVYTGTLKPLEEGGISISMLDFVV